MNRSRIISYPYPVLGIGDDLTSRETKLLLEPVTDDGTNYNMHVAIDMDNSDIDGLALSGHVQFGCEVECSATFYRRWFGYSEREFDIVIPKNCVAKRVNFHFMAMVVKEIPEYRNFAFHPDYEGVTFNMPIGSIVATFGYAHYDADIKYDRLHSAGAFISIIKGTDSDNTLYNIDDDKIEVKLPLVLYDDYKDHYSHANCRWGDIFHSSIAYNALVYALLNYDEDKHKSTLWARTLKYRMEVEPSLRQYRNVFDKEKTSGNDVLKLSQALLGNPYRRMFQKIHVIQDSSRANEDSIDE